MSIITGTGIFTDTSSNEGTVTIAEFTENSVNSGTIVTVATFSGSSSNEGTIEGNATFTGTSTNAVGTTINGTVVFSSGAINNGTVTNAVFLDGAKNGPNGVVTNGTFSGTSTNEGAVTNGTFTENTTINTGTVTNPVVPTGYSNNTGTFTNTATTYTQADGAFSYGYFSGGVKTAPPNYQTVVYQVGSFWYKYDASGNGALAQGEFNDGTSLRVFKNGIRTSVGTIALAGTTYYYELPLAQGSILYTNNTITNKAVAATGAGLDIDGNLEEDDWVISAGGAVSWGDIPRYGAYKDGYYSNDAIVNGYTNTTPQTARNSLGDWYVYTTGIGASANGAYTNGYFTNAVKGGTYNTPQFAIDNNSAWFVYTSGVPTSATGSYTVGKFSSGVKTGTTTTPVTALDNENAYYVYNSGNPSLASGAYSIGYFATGTIATGYTNNTPVTPQDSGFYYVYNSGEASKATGVYSNGAFTNGLVHNLNSTAPQQAIDDSKWYMYTSGSVSVTANGVYSNGYYETGVKNNSYANTLPQSAANEVGKWYVFASGIPTAASGAYTNGYYVAGELSTTTTTIPQSAQNNSAAWFIYTNGVAASASGAYSNGYFNNGVKDTEYDSLNGTPENIPQDDNLWYVFTNGIPVTASGAYSNGYYAYGLIDSSYNSPNGTPQDITQDDLLWYIYTTGVASVATGAYTNGYFTAGAKTGNYSTPLSAQDNNQLWYTYTSGTSLTASGAYSNGFYVYGDLNETYTNSLPQSGKDSGVWYVFTNGVQTSASGLYSNFAFNSNGSINTSYTTAVPQSAVNDNLWYTYNAGVATAAISSIELNNVTYYHIGNLNNGVSKLYSNSSVTTLVVSTSGIDDVTGDQVDERWRTDNLGKFYWGVPKSLNNITYYYEGPLIQNTTVFYTNSGLTILATNLSGNSDDLNNDSVNDVWTTNSSGIISWSKELILGGTTYYYSGDLYNARNNSGTTVLYTNSSLTTIASNLTGFDRVQVNIQQEDIYNYWYTDSVGALNWYESTKITSEGTDYFYTRDQVSPWAALNGYTILYTDSSLSSVAASLTGSYDWNNDTFVENWSTDANGVLSWVAGVTVQSVQFYYQGRLVGGNNPVQLFITSLLDTPATAYATYTSISDFDNDGQYERITIDANGYAIINRVFELSSNTSQLWVEDPIVNGVTQVYTNNMLNQPYGADSQPIIALSGNLYSAFIKAYTGYLYFTPFESITNIYTNVAYYITKALSGNDTFVVAPETDTGADSQLFTGSSNSLVALTYAPTVSGIGYLNSESKYVIWDWDYTSSHFNRLEAIIPLAVDGGTYYYTGTLTSGTTILYLTPALSSVAANLSGTNDIFTEDPPDNYAEEYWYTNSSGLITWEGVNTTLTNSVTTVYFLGTMTNQGTTIFSDSDLNQPLANSSGTIDISGTNYSFTTNANGVITYVQSSSFTIRGATYYYQTGAGFNSGSITIYTNNSLTNAASNLQIYDDSMWGPSLNYSPAIITTNGSGVLSWETAYGPIDWSGDAEDYYYAGTLTSGSTTIYKASDGLPPSSTSGIDESLPGTSGAQYVTVTNGIISWEPINTISLNAINYYYVGTLTNGTTVIYSDSTLETLAASLDGVQDMDSDTEADVWETDASGVISWVPVSSINLGGTLYYYQGTLTSGTTIVYTTDALTTPAADLSGINDIDGAGNDAWSTDASGVLSWVPYTEPESITLDGTTYYYTGGSTLTSGTTVLYTDNVLTAEATNISGVDLISGTNSQYSTDGAGIITWTPVITLTLDNTSYYHTGTLTSGTTVLYTDDELTTLATNLVGAETLGGQLQKYTTNGSGVITLVNVYSITLNSTSYYYEGTLTSGTTVLYTEDSLVTLASGLSGNADDIDGGGNDTWSTDGSGVLSWSAGAPPNTIVINSTTYYYDANDTLIVGTVLYTNDSLTTAAASITGVGSNVYYVTDGTGAITTADTVNNTSLDSTTYYYTGTLTSGTTVLYTDGDLTTIATSVSGPSPANQDLDNDSNNDTWSTDGSGIISWSMYVAHANSALGSYYSDDNPLVSSTSIIYTGQGSGASVLANGSGTYDIDGGGDDNWSTDGSGVITWTN